MAFRQIKSPAIANKAVVSTKLDPSAVTGQTSAPGVASLANDTLLMHSAGDNALRKLSVANLVNSLSTGNLAEGTNLYFTDARAQAAVAQDIADAVDAEAQLRQAADSTLTTNLAAEVSRAQAAEATLTSDLAAEVSRATARENAIESGYQTADANLQTQINNILNNVDETALNSLAEIVAEFQAQDTAISAAVTANANAISAETTNRQNADLVLQGNIDNVQAELDATQTGAGLAADGSYVANNTTIYINSATSLNDADVKLAIAINNVDTAYKAADTTINNSITAIDGRVTVNEGDIAQLETDLAAEVTRATGAETANAQAITDEINARVIAVQGAKDYADAQDALLIGDATVDGTAGNTITDRIATSLASAQSYADTAEADAVATANAYTDAREAAITTAYQAYADQAEADAITSSNAYADSILGTYSSTVSTDLSDLVATDVSLQSQINSIISNTDEVALNSLQEIVDAFQAADSSLTGLIGANTTAISNEATTRESADTTLQANIDSEATTRANADSALQTAIDNEEAARIAADSSLQAELDATQAGAGLGADGSYVANGDANYISAATSLKDADNKLDAALKAEADARIAADISINSAIAANTANISSNDADIAQLGLDITAEANTRSSADATLQGNIDDVQAELDATQGGAGLAADGSYVANGSANYISTAVSLKDADTKLDAAIKVNADGLAAEITNRTNAVSAEESARIAADNALTTAINNETTRATTAESNLSDRITANDGDITTLQNNLTTEIQARVDGDVTLSGKIDTVESSSGLSADGAYVADATKTYINDATTLFNADQQLDDAIVAEVARATAAEGVLQGNIDAEATARSTADTTLQGNIDTVSTDLATEVTNRTNADTTLQGNIDTVAGDLAAEVTRATAAEGVLTSNLAAEVTRATGAESALDARLTTEEANVDSLQAFTGEGTVLSTTATDLAGAVNEIVAALGTSEAGLAGELDAVEGSLGTAVNTDGTFAGYTGTNYIDLATSMSDADVKLDTAIKTTDARVDAILAGSSESLDQFVEVVTAFQNADSSLNNAITNLADAAGADRTAIRSEFAAADAALQTQITANDGDIATLQSDLAAEVTRATTAEGVNATAIATETTRATTAEGVIASDLADEVTRATGEEARIEGKVDTNAANLAQEILDRTADVDAEETRALAAEAALSARIDTEHQHHIDGDAALQTELDATQASVGSAVNADGTFAGYASTNYINAATSMADADVKLDAAIKVNADGLAAEITRATGAESTLQGNIDAEATTRANADTTLQGNIDAEATTRANADTTLQGNIDTVAANLAQEILDRTADVDAEETRALAAEGVLQGNIDAEEAARIAAVSAEASARATEDTSIRTDFASADASIRTDFAAADTLIQQELDATQTGAGLGTDGAYTANGSANYISAATSLKDADNKLDAALKAVDTAYKAADVTLQTNIDAEATARASADTTLQNNINAEATTRANADSALDGRLTVVETEMTATQTGAGLATDGTYTANGTANYISTAVSLKDADNKLDAAIKAEETRATGEEARIEAKVDAEVTRATTAEGNLADSIQAVANNLAQELIDRAAADTNLQGQIDFIVSNTDAAALDSLTEVVAAFQSADSDLLTTVTANTSAINSEVTRATDAEAALLASLNTEIADRQTQDGILDTKIDTKVSKAGDTMSGDLAMGGNKVTGLAAPALAGDAANKQYVDTGLANQHISVFTTGNLTEGSNLYYTDARSRAAISAVDVEGNGDFSYNATTGVISADLSKSFLELTDVTDTDFVGKADYVAVVNATEDGIELVHASELQIFGQTYRQVIDGDGNQTTFALNFLADDISTLVFVGGVIQDPTTHYTISNGDQTITFTEALPLGTQAVVIARELVGASPFVATGSISEDKLASGIKVMNQSGNTAAGVSGSVVDSFDASTYRSAKYIIQVDNGAGEFETREALVIHDGTTAYITEYAMVYTGAGLLGDASVQMNGTNVELIYTANAAGTSVKVISTYIDA